MNNQISVESLTPVSHVGVSVITTELLAQLYGTEIINIQVNHTRNRERFIEGKHYFKVVGDDLKVLRVTLSKSQDLQPSLRGLQISPKARSLILWTERGAARHAKMLETDQAWEVFEKLEDFYFAKSEATPKAEPIKSEPQKQVTFADCRVLQTYNAYGVITESRVAEPDEMLTSPKGFIELMMRRK